MAARAACSELVILYVFEKLGEFAADKRKEILSMCVGLSAKVVKINDGVAKITDEDDSETDQVLEDLF